jgi:PIN domain nuclease of toxin-antitoxin system
VRFLLDTHVVLWALEDHPRLAPAARALLADPANEFWVSAASAWEIAIKVALGKLALRQPLANFESAVVEAGFETMDVTMRHAAAAAQVATRHADPFDRLLLAQCEVETLKLLTADRHLKGWAQSASAD